MDLLKQLPRAEHNRPRFVYSHSRKALWQGQPGNNHAILSKSSENKLT
jgi:hypothetical protein